MHYIDFITHASTWLAYLTIFLIIFAECGLLIGFVLPGDTLLFPLGIIASQHFLSLSLIIIIASIASILGNATGYLFGYRIGPTLFTRKNSLLFRQENVEKARLFYESQGGRTIILARFLPIIRTFAPIVAGIAKMPYSTFMLYNCISGIIWVAGISLAGYYLGKVIPNIDHYVIPISLLILVASVLSSYSHFRPHSKNGKP